MPVKIPMSWKYHTLYKLPYIYKHDHPNFILTSREHLRKPQLAPFYSPLRLFFRMKISATFSASWPLSANTNGHFERSSGFTRWVTCQSSSCKSLIHSTRVGTSSVDCSKFRQEDRRALCSITFSQPSAWQHILATTPTTTSWDDYREIFINIIYGKDLMYTEKFTITSDDDVMVSALWGLDLTCN